MLPGAQELQSARLRSLVFKFTESYKAAFFAPRLLLLEGASDEIIASTLAAQLGIPISAGGGQIVPVSGKGSLPHAVKLFKLIGKEPVVLADLDDLADIKGSRECLRSRRAPQKNMCSV